MKSKEKLKKDFHIVDTVVLGSKTGENERIGNSIL